MRYKMFAEAKSILAGVEQARELLRREIERKCDWDDPGDCGVYRSQMRSEKRKEILDKLVPDRICPTCEQTGEKGREDALHPNSRSWVINAEQTMAVCRSCWMRQFEAVQIRVTGKIFGEKQIRYSIDWKYLRQLRKKSRVTVGEFARRAGWSRPYQLKVESKYTKSVTESTADTILQVLRQLGISTQDRIVVKNDTGRLTGE